MNERALFKDEVHVSLNERSWLLSINSHRSVTFHTKNELHQLQNWFNLPFLARATIITEGVVSCKSSFH